MADADRIKLSIVEELEFGVTPTKINKSGATYAIVAADQSINDSGSGFVTDGFQVGSIIRVAGFTSSNNNGDFKVLSVAAGKMELDTTVLTDEAEGDTVTIDTPILKEMRLTSESLHQETDTVVSAEIRDDRQIADVVRTKISAAGDLGIELSFDAYDDFLKAALMAADWSAVVEETGATYSMVAADNSINDSASQFVIDGFVANQWIKVSGFTGDVNNNDLDLFILALIDPEAYYVQTGLHPELVGDINGDWAMNNNDILAFVTLLTAPQYILGDMDGSRSVNNNDIEPFVLGLVDPDAYFAQYGLSPDLVGDINPDGSLNNNDIESFVQLLIGSASVPEPGALGLLMLGAVLLRRRRGR